MEFNSLPPEIQLAIFSYLPIRKLMKIRQVCKQWNDLINNEFKFTRIHCLQCHKYRGPPCTPDFYFTSTRPFIDYVSTDTKFRYVKKLNAKLISKFTELEETFDFLNSFRLIEHLNCYYSLIDLHGGNPAVKKKELILSLDHLKRAELKFTPYTFKPVSITLDLPNLKSLLMAENPLEVIIIRHPEALQTLVTGGGFLERRFSPSFLPRQDLSKFTSLAFIYADVGDRLSISASFIEKLPSLRELHLGIYYNSNLFIDHVSQAKPPSPGKAAPRIFYWGFEVTLDQISSGEWPPQLHFDEASSQIIAHNLHRSLDKNRFVTKMEYNSVTSELNDHELFSVLPQKLSNICFLEITGTVADEQRLLRFMRQFRGSYLKLERTNLSRRLLEQLAENCPSITSLVIGREPTMNVLSGDFDFIFRMNNLTGFRFDDFPLSLNFVARALRVPKIRYVCISQPRIYEFKANLKDEIPWISLEMGSYRGGYIFRYFSSNEEAPAFLNYLSSLLRADEFVCHQKLMALLRQIELEEKTALFMMHKCIYEPSIYVQLEQMLNAPR